MTSRKRFRWGILWRSDNRVDGRTRRFMNSLDTSLPILFKTRRDAQAYIEKHYSYIKLRDDLQKEPFGWKVPQPVKVEIVSVFQDGVDISVSLMVKQ